ncbi:malate permease [Clostridium sp. D2Q-11]|uniref:Malate permease n=1 Tax=Anaeromonas frigoriresistens TaxID=2683708 RepID=A0A942V0M8_9FIRM|nr:AEC family transporter [Anaeromonas frigoriresistens]MBS4539007.1 malate permease [Anaeromonas frigoriresistens]
MEEIISKVIPIILLIALGYLMQYRNMVKSESIEEIKKGVINIALPPVLFLTFRDMTLKKEYFLVVLYTFILLIALYIIGILLNKIKYISHPLVPFVVTAFTFGLLGIPLYGSVFGIENLEKISILGIGHEFFIWFIFYTLMKIKFKGESFSLEVVKGFIKSPLILAIIFGLILNVTGYNILFKENSLLKGLDITLEYLSSMATPLILIIIGFGLKINKKYMKQSIKLTIIRIVTILVVGYAFKFILIDKIIVDDKLFDYAFFTLLILPPPYSLPIFVGEYANDEYRDIANNVVVLNTITCIVMYVSFVFLI